MGHVQTEEQIDDRFKETCNVWEHQGISIQGVFKNPIYQQENYKNLSGKKAKGLLWISNLPEKNPKGHQAYEEIDTQVYL